MARQGVDYETVKQTAVKLLSQGIAPSVQKIRETLGTGSNTTLAHYLKIWREEYAQKAIHHLPATLPPELISPLEVLWQTAMEQAQQQLSTYKQALDAEHEKIMQGQQQTERELALLKQQLSDVMQQQTLEFNRNQVLTVELAVANDRLEKNQQQVIDQKQHHEEQLKQFYTEKDSMLIQQHQLQNDIKLLQEKLAEQAEKHQQAFTQQLALQEQSENRWLQLIDQAKQEALSVRKEYQNRLALSEEKAKNSDDQLAKTQRLFHDKSTELKLAVEQMNQSKQAIKMLESELIEAKSTIMKFEKEHKLKKSIAKAVITKLKKSNKWKPEIEIASE